MSFDNDISQIPIAWLPPKAQLQDKVKEYVDDVSVTVSAAGFLIPFGPSTGDMQAAQSSGLHTGGFKHPNT